MAKLLAKKSKKGGWNWTRLGILRHFESLINILKYKVKRDV